MNKNLSYRVASRIVCFLFLCSCFSAIGEESSITKQQIAIAKLQAEKGDAKAQFFLGAVYSCGKDVQQNYYIAAAWWKNSAKQGYAPAEGELGRCYLFGQGVSKDYGAAGLLLQQAYSQGYTSSEPYLGMCYLYGWGLKKDLKLAKKLLLHSAMLGRGESQVQLALMYFFGKEVVTDQVEGLAWQYVAAYTYNSHEEVFSLDQIKGMQNIKNVMEGDIGADGRILAQQRAKQIMEQIASVSSQTHSENDESPVHASQPSSPSYQGQPK